MALDKPYYFENIHVSNVTVEVSYHKLVYGEYFMNTFVRFVTNKMLSRVLRC